MPRVLLCGRRSSSCFAVIRVEPFAKQMTADAKKLEEDEETSAQKYRYIKTGENHCGYAFNLRLDGGGELPLGPVARLLGSRRLEQQNNGHRPSGNPRINGMD